MLLAIDIGNTNIVGCIFDKDSIVFKFRAFTDKNKTADEYYALFDSILRGGGIDVSVLKKISISSVVPSIDDLIKTAFLKYYKINPYFIKYSENIKLSVRLKIKNPGEAGADRIANAEYAATKFSGNNVILADLGTATTIDVITKKGDYVGGVIAPGMALSARALFEGAAKLFKVDYSVIPAKTIGTDTDECIRSGIIFGYASMIEGLIRRIISERRFDDQMIIITGGFAETLRRVCPIIDEADMDITLKGIKIIYEKNHS